MQGVLALLLLRLRLTRLRLRLLLRLRPELLPPAKTLPEALLIARHCCGPIRMIGPGWGS